MASSETTEVRPQGVNEALDAVPDTLAAPLVDYVERLEGSVRFLLCFFEPDKHRHLDTNAMKVAVNSAKHLLGRTDFWP